MTSLHPPAEDAAEQREWWREAVTMALYLSLSLLAVLVALPTDVALTEPNPGATVLLTAVGLLLAHQVAFRVSTRLVNRGVLDAAGLRLLGAQLVGGLAVAALATLPVLVLGGDGVAVAEGLLLAFVAATGYRAARSVPATRARALVYVGVLVVVVAAVLAVKSLVGH